MRILVKSGISQGANQVWMQKMKGKSKIFIPIARENMCKHFLCKI